MSKNNQKEIILLKDLGMLCLNEKSKRKRRYGLYKCFCGKEFNARTENINSGNTTSCGCYNRQKIKKSNTVHGLANHRLYDTWRNIISRCNNPKNKKYKDYGARGIKVSDRWHSVENFINDMYPTYQEGLTLDRVNVNGNYEFTNCRWTTYAIQSRNTRILKSTNKSGYRGVYWSNRDNKWISQIRVNSKNIYIGSFLTALDGALAYDNYVIQNNLEHTRNFS